MVLSKQYQIQKLEYRIRKMERGIRVLHKQGKVAEMLEYGKNWESLLDELEKLTGKREPVSPQWPV